MTTPEDEGGMCLRCGEMYFGEDHDQHQHKLNLKSGTVFKFTEKGLTVTAKILQANGDNFREDYPAHYMCEIQKVEQDGEDRTEEMLEKAFNGEKTRGIPLNQVCDIEDFEVVSK